MGKDSYYDILGVPPTAPPDLIRSQYRSLIQRVHPDLGGPIALFRQVQESYEVLSDPVRRAGYDRTLEAVNRAGSRDHKGRPTRSASARRPPPRRSSSASARSRGTRLGHRHAPHLTDRVASRSDALHSLHRDPARVVAVAGAGFFALGAALGPDDLGRGALVLGVLVLIAASVALRGARGVKECEAFRRGGMAAVDAMTGRQFRALLEHFFACQGYRVARLRARGDVGDLLISDPQGRTIVQLKRLSGMVRSDSVQRAVVAKAHYGASRVLLVTSSNYSEEAVMAATSNGVTLWSRATLDSELSLFDGDSMSSGVKRLTSDLRAGTRICVGVVVALFVAVFAASTKERRRERSGRTRG